MGGSLSILGLETPPLNAKFVRGPVYYLENMDGFDSLAFSGKDSEGSDYSLEAYAAHDKNKSSDWELEAEMANDPCVVVSTISPFTVLDGSDSWFEMTGFKRQQILGRTLRMLQGPSTDVELLKSLIAGAKMGVRQHQASLLTFYLSSGEEFLCGVHATDSKPIDGREACTLYMHYSEATTLKTAQDDPKQAARLLLSCQGGNVIEYVSPAWCSMFCYLEQQVRGRSVNLILSPMTDKKKWAGLVKGALRGITRHDCLTLADSQCNHITCQVDVVPILAEAGGFMSKLMMIFSKKDGEVPPIDASFPSLQAGGAAAAGAQHVPQPSIVRAPSATSSISSTTTASSAVSKSGVKARSSPDMAVDRRAYLAPDVSFGGPSTTQDDHQHHIKSSTLDRAAIRHILAMQKRAHGHSSIASHAQMPSAQTKTPNADPRKDPLSSSTQVKPDSSRSSTQNHDGRPGHQLVDKPVYTSSLMAQVRAQISGPMFN